MPNEDQQPTSGASGRPLEVRYDFVASDELDQKASEQVASGAIRVWHSRVEQVSSLRIDGPCVRCWHRFTQTRVIDLPLSSVRGSPPSVRTAVDTVTADFLCDCDVTHPDTPAGERGCGASFSVTSAQ